MTFAEFGFDSWPLAPDVAEKFAPAPTEGAKFALVPAVAGLAGDGVVVEIMEPAKLFVVELLVCSTFSG